jgi:hypothetical protein
MNALTIPQAYRRLFYMQATILIGHESPGDNPAQMIGQGPRIASHAEDDARSQRTRLTLVVPLRTTTASRTSDLSLNLTSVLADICSILARSLIKLEPRPLLSSRESSTR